jgi:benzoyl-CoA reductase/2-hydroxyglutaryl-CoA dehydratase subunit BcrC/BadD/HgdB
MMDDVILSVGFTCTYTPLALIDAAGFAPYRVLPVGSSPESAGPILHENLCPHVKRILDRALDEDLPQLAGMVFLNSCDAMRRLYDAWQRVRPDDGTVLIDLPVCSGEGSVLYFARELSRLGKVLSEWSGRPLSPDAIRESVERYNVAAVLFKTLAERARHTGIDSGAARLQSLYNFAVTHPLKETCEMLKRAAAQPEPTSAGDGGAPVFAFGNVFPDPEAFGLFESCGLRVVEADFCSGSRQFVPMETGGSSDVMTRLARALLSKPRCARTLHEGKPGAMAEEVLERAAAFNARGVIACAAKFCDPYMARIPGLRKMLRASGLPLLQIEGDCTMRALGQHRTRIEAFSEMLRR